MIQSSPYSSTRTSGRQKPPDVPLDVLEQDLNQLANQYAQVLEGRDAEVIQPVSLALSEQLAQLSTHIHRHAQNQADRDRMRRRLDPLLNRIEGLIHQSTVLRDQYAEEMAGTEGARWNGERLADVYQGEPE